VFPGEEDALTILRREKEGGAIHMADGGLTIEEFLRKQGY
jgi:hypothetical protein